jgi:hypothetical protein
MKLKTEIDFQFFFEENENSYSDLVTQIAWCYRYRKKKSNIIITKSKIFILLPITLILYFKFFHKTVDILCFSVTSSITVYLMYREVIQQKNVPKQFQDKRTDILKLYPISLYIVLLNEQL